jgi:hypothetical protein
MTIRQAVAFAFMMENNEGIMGKSPSYVLEKMEQCLTHRKPDEQIFHPTLKAQFDQWAEIWGVKW